MTLQAIFDADRSLRVAERALLKNRDGLADELATAVKEAKSLEDIEERVLRLERLADLCAQVPGPKMADAILAILDEDEPSVRVAAGEALLDFAYDYYAEVAHAIDRALERGETGPAMCELPFILAEVGEPGAAKQLKRFLQSKEADVVASAIEASVALMEEDMAEAVGALVTDTRRVTIEEFDAETSTTIGELAAEAKAMLSELAGLDE